MDERTLLRGILAHDERVIWEKESLYAKIFGVQNGSDAWVAKLPACRMLAVLSEERRREHVAFLQRATDAFSTRLKACRVPLPRQYEVSIVEGYPFHRVSYEGVDCAKQIRCDRSVALPILRSILLSIQGVLRDGKEKVGIDARLENFAGDSAAVVYIDIFPPLVFFDGKYCVHYPNPEDPHTIRKEVERKFRPFGILRRLRFDCLVIGLELEQCFFEALTVLDQPLREEMQIAFDGLPDASLRGRSAEEIRSLVRAIDIHDVDTMREVAAKIIPLTGEERQRVLHEVFVCSSLAAARDEADRTTKLVRYHEIVDSFI